MPLDVDFQVDKNSGPEVNIAFMRNGRLSIDSNGRNILDGKMALSLPKDDD